LVRLNAPERHGAQKPTGETPRLAYIVSGFPTLTETFVLYEMIQMEELGVRIELYPLRRLRTTVNHSETGKWIHRAHFRPFLSFSILRAQWQEMQRNPGAYFKLWAEVLGGTWGSLNYFLGALAIFPKAVVFAREMKELGVTHIHAQFANHPAVAALIAHRLTGIPFSFTARGTDVQVDRHMLKQKLDASEFAIAVAAYNKKIMAEECGPDAQKKIHVIYGGVDVERLTPNPHSHSMGPFRILCVGRFEEVKGHRYLVEACRLLRDRGVAFECRLVGEGPLVATIEKQIKQAGLSNEVRLLGGRTYQEVIQELRRTDVVVSPAVPTRNGKREGIPNVLKEAMACGVPVVASAVGGIPELVEDGQSGILVAPRDAALLADALKGLSSDPVLRSRLGRSGRAKVERDFNLKTSTTKRAQLFLGHRVHSRRSRDVMDRFESQIASAQTA
jgi:colanic acid/amylovoran biosynthesis glycosyltransferase